MSTTDPHDPEERALPAGRELTRSPWWGAGGPEQVLSGCPYVFGQEGPMRPNRPGAPQTTKVLLAS